MSKLKSNRTEMLTDNSTTTNYEALLSIGVPKHLLDTAIEKGASTDRLIEKLNPSCSKKPDLLITREWQLNLLGQENIDVQAISEEIWKKDNKPYLDDIADFVAWAGNLLILDWVKDNQPELLEEKNVFGLKIVYYAVRYAKLPILDWIKNNKPELLEKKYFGGNIAHIAARLDNLLVLDWIKNNKPELLEKKYFGGNIAHIAARLDNLLVLDWIKNNNPELLEKKDNHGYTIAHIAVTFTNLIVLDWIKNNNPQVLEEKDNDGQTIVFHAVIPNNPRVLDWIKNNNPELLEKENNAGNIAYIAARLDNLLVLDWIKNNNPELLEKKDNHGYTFAHNAVRFTSLLVLDWIKNNNPELLEKKDDDGYTFAHNAVRFTSPLALNWIKNNNPELLEKKDNHGYTIAHIAITLSNLTVLSWIKNNNPELLEKKDDDGYTIAHNMARFGESASLKYLFNNHPEVIIKIWTKNNNGQLPQDVAPSDMNPTPNQIRDEALLSATTRIIQGESKTTDMALLEAFHEDWQALLNNETINQNIITTLPKAIYLFSPTLQKATEQLKLNNQKQKNTAIEYCLNKIFDKCLPNTSTALAEYEHEFATDHKDKLLKILIDNYQDIETLQSATNPNTPLGKIFHHQRAEYQLFKTKQTRTIQRLNKIIKQLHQPTIVNRSPTHLNCGFSNDDGL